MIEILQKNNELIRVDNCEDLSTSDIDFHIIQFIDYNENEINWAKNKFKIDVSIMKHFEDIEISSHYVADKNQISFHISIPYYNKDKILVEEPSFFIITRQGMFFFSNSDVDDFFNQSYSLKLAHLQNSSIHESIFKFHIEFIADYYADITESESRKVKSLANAILIEKEFNNEVLDIITRYNFNNLLLKEALIETTRVFNLYKKSKWDEITEIRPIIESELHDLSVVSDYIQFNFERLDDLKENVSNKIDIEQNHIFKMLTVVTVCVSLPTFIAGVFGMNFENMPELKLEYGYPAAIAAMVLSAVLPFLFFKKRKWV